MIFRTLTPGDLDLVYRHREAMFCDMGRDEAALELMRRPFRAWLALLLTDAAYFGFVARHIR